jgi:organic radical activating enzyme
MLLPGEKMMEVSLYVGCSINCSYCPQFSLFKRSKQKRLSLETYKVLLDKIPTSTIIGFIGMSEPLLHKEFDKIALYTASKGYKMVCFTTLPDKYNYNVNVFLDKQIWYNRSIHIRDEHMSYKNIDEKYLENLDTFLAQLTNRESENKDTITVLTKNLNKDISSLFEKHRVTNLVYYTEPFKRINAPIDYKTPVIPTKLNGKITCSQGHHKIQHLLPDGDVVLCCMDVEKNHVLGNLYNMNYNDLYSGDVYKNVMKAFGDETVKSICRECIFAENVK